MQTTKMSKIQHQRLLATSIQVFHGNQVKTKKKFASYWKKWARLNKYTCKNRGLSGLFLPHPRIFAETTPLNFFDFWECETEDFFLLSSFLFDEKKIILQGFFDAKALKRFLFTSSVHFWNYTLTFLVLFWHFGKVKKIKSIFN